MSTVVIGAWEGDVDYRRTHDVLDGRITMDLRKINSEAQAQEGWVSRAWAHAAITE